jgi:hypothetical protein
MRHVRKQWWIAMPFLFAGFAFAIGWIVMSLWNYILVPVLAVGALSFWQALGLLVLCRILFGGFKGKSWGGRPGPWKDKWMNMSEEEKMRMKDEWQRRCRQRSWDRNSHQADPQSSSTVDPTA